LDGLTVTPYQKEVGNGRQRIAYSLRATGMSTPHYGSKAAVAASGSNGTSKAA
jgi:hypothetical protein